MNSAKQINLPGQPRIITAKTRHDSGRRRKQSLWLLLVAVVVLPSCGFSARIPPSFDPCKDLDQIEPAPAVTPVPSVSFEQPGTIKVMHGVTRATGANAKNFLRVEQSVELPPYAQQATVFLNGWEADYDDTDHHLDYVASLIGRIKVVPGTQGTPGKISWTATGYMSDDDESGAFTWTYRYMIIAWNPAVVQAMVDHNDAEHFCKSKEADGDDNFFIGESVGKNPKQDVATTTALSSFSSFLKNGGFATGRQVAVLPRGFAFFWRDGNRHLLQLAYNLESVAPFVRPQRYHKANSMMDPLANSSGQQAGGEFVSWKTSVIIKDNKLRRDYDFVEFVSGMGGTDVEIIQPEFTVLPRYVSGAASSGANLKSAQVVVNNLPYLCAVPVLTGWDIGYEGSDQHVKQLGVFIDHVSYVRPPGASGTLRYEVFSIVKDKDSAPDNYFRHKVTILGLKPGVAAPPVG